MTVMNDEENIDNFEDVTFTPDEENSGGSTISGEGKLNKQKEKIEKLNAEKDEYLLNWQKERADFVNYKREEENRLNRARAIGFERGLEGVIKMLDTFDMAMSNTESWTSVDANWRMGVEYIYNEGLKFLQDSGIEIISPAQNSAVDPNIHESVETVETEDEKLDHTVASVIQKGYRTREYVIRPAKVAVYMVK